MRRAAWWLAAALLTWSAPLAAQSARATELFEEGRALFTAGRFGDACPLFRQSYELDPRVGTILNLAECQDRRGFIAESYRAWLEAEALARQMNDERVDFASDNRARVGAKVARLTLVLPAERPPGTTIRFEPPDSPPRVLTPSDIGGELYVDDGTTSVLVEAPGHEPRRHEIALDQGEAQRLRLALGAPLPRDEGMGPLFWTGVIVGGAGVVTIGVGAMVGLLASDKHDEAFWREGDGSARRNALCDPADGAAPACGDEGIAIIEDAKLLADVATGLWVVGGIATATGVTLAVVGLTAEPDGGDSAWQLDIAPGSVGLRAVW